MGLANNGRDNNDKGGMVTSRVLVLRAGSALGNNVIRSLKAGDPSLVILGCHHDRFVLKKSEASRNLMVPLAPDMFPGALRRIVGEESIDLLIPTTDEDVLTIARLRPKLPCRVFLPRKSVIERCQDKYELSVFLRSRGIPAPETHSVTSLDKIEEIFDRLSAHPQLWCRIRAGTGSFGAIPVKTPRQARAWIEYWEEMRNIRPGSFTLSEYLPGRDFSVQSLWKEGRLVLAKMAERITYLDNGSPSGVSSMPALAKTANETRVFKACAQAIPALDPGASGVFMIDVKEDAAGLPCITEINAGRFATMTNIHDLAGKHNMAVAYVRLALGEPTGINDVCDYDEDCYFVRSVDTLPGVFRLAELYQGIESWKP